MNNSESSGIKSRLINGVKWNVVEAGIVAGTNLVVAVVVARMLGINDFGAFPLSEARCT